MSSNIITNKIWSFSLKNELNSFSHYGHNIFNKLHYSSSTKENGILGLVLNKDGKGGCLVDVRTKNEIIVKSDYFKRLVKRLAATSLFLGDTTTTSSTPSIPEHSSKKRESKPNKITKCQPIDVTQLGNVPLLPHPDANPIDESEFQFQLVNEALKHCSWKLNDSIQLKRAIISPQAQRVVTGGYIMVLPEGKNVESSIDIMDASMHLTDEDKIFQSQGYGKIASLLTLSLKGKRSKATAVSRKMSRFANQLARHIVIFNPKYISEADMKKKVKREITEQDYQDILLNQKFIFDTNQTVAEALTTVGEIDDVKVEVTSFVRWTL